MSDHRAASQSRSPRRCSRTRRVTASASKSPAARSRSGASVSATKSARAPRNHPENGALNACLRRRRISGGSRSATAARRSHLFERKPPRRMRAGNCFALVLSWSRACYARFALDQTLESFLRGHVEAFAALQGVPRTILYDNLKSVVLERVGDHIRFHPRVLELAGHYHFAPQPCAVARGNEKGYVAYCTSVVGCGADLL